MLNTSNFRNPENGLDEYEMGKTFDIPDGDTSFESDFVDDEQGMSIEYEIACWATKFNISLSAFSALLFILRLFKMKVPKDAPTLLKTCTNHNILELAGGTYIYLGFEKALKQHIANTNVRLPNSDSLTLHVNVDGLPLFKSSKLQLWPILGMLTEIHKSGPFPIALFFLVSKSRLP